MSESENLLYERRENARLRDIIEKRSCDRLVLESEHDQETAHLREENDALCKGMDVIDNENYALRAALEKVEEQILTPFVTWPESLDTIAKALGREE